MTRVEAFEAFLAASNACLATGDADTAKLEAEERALRVWLDVAKAEAEAAKAAAWSRYMAASAEVRTLKASGADPEDVRAAQVAMFRTMRDYLAAMRAAG